MLRVCTSCTLLLLDARNQGGQHADRHGSMHMHISQPGCSPSNNAPSIPPAAPPQICAAGMMHCGTLVESLLNQKLTCVQGWHLITSHPACSLMCITAPAPYADSLSLLPALLQPHKVCSSLLTRHFVLLQTLCSQMCISRCFAYAPSTCPHPTPQDPTPIACVSAATPALQLPTKQ